MGNEFTPHEHLCELKMIYYKSWKKYCHLKGHIKNDECDVCRHLRIVSFEDKEQMHIVEIV
jgi:hypothetical protein